MRFEGLCLVALGLIAFLARFLDAGIVLTLMGIAVLKAKKTDFEN